jgi:tRNA pseudouridine55 synthase
MTAEDVKNGQVLLIDKPLEWTSFQVVNKVRWLLRKQYGLKKLKVGHAGTLDPLATGLLVLCTGRFTKKIETFQGQEKEYTGTITLGATTPSYDMETAIDGTFPIAHISEEKLQEATKDFIGVIQQRPPVFSALKKDGKRLYDYARSGEAVEIAARTVHISEFKITRFEGAEVDFRVVCGKGTYIRSLAHDFGRALQTGAYLSALRRTRIGSFEVAEAMTLEAYEASLNE